MKIINITIAIALISCSVSVSAKAPPPGTGKADVPANILLMLDTSGSMGWKTNQARLFEKPTGVCVDSNGNQFIVEEARHKVLKFDPTGSLIKVIGKWGRGNGSFYYPFKCEIDKNDNLYVSDYYNHRAQKFDNNGNLLQIFNGAYYASGIGVDDSGNVYVGQRHKSRIKKFNSSGRALFEFVTGYAPYGISIHNDGVMDIVYVVTMWQQRQQVQRYTTNGNYTPLTNHNNISPNDPHITLQNGNYISSVEVNDNGIYVAHTTGHYVDHYALNGAYIGKVGTHGTGSGQFQYVWAIDSDKDGNIYATDWYNHRVNKFTKDLVYISDLNGSANTRLEDARKVIKQIVSSSELNKSANFGLMDWNSRATMRVNISSTGAAEIYKMIDTLKTGGGTEIQHAMELARSYFRGSNTPIKYSCQKTMMIVITDGGFTGNVQAGYNAATDLYNNSTIPTVVISFHGGTQTTHKNLAEAGGTYTNDGIDNDISPIEASSWQQLYIALADMIRQTIESRQTFTKPVILPGISGGDDYIFQSTFLYKNFNNKLGTCTSDGKNSESCQWQGHLNKYKLLKDGKVSKTSEWDAGKLLNTRNSSDRNIWSMLKFMGADTTINNFNTSNLIEIKMVIDEASGKLSSDAEVTDLINFVRGIDAYDENKNNNKTEERWKLADIYHSELKVVGVPNAKVTDDANRGDTEAYYRYQKNYNNFKNGNRCGGSCPSRKEVAYVGANDGMLHAFDAKTGKELWAFIPPGMVKNLPKLSSVKPNTSNSIYGVDGSIVVKDIYFDKKDGKGTRWYTVLIAGQGRGGQSYFALDITNPNAPDFLFAFENDIMDQRIFHWDGDGNRESLSYVSSILPEFDYSKIGEAWSAPMIVAMPENNTRKWVAVFGAGYNGGVNSDYGSSIYVIDLENNGKVLKRIDLTDVSSNISNSVPASLVSITPDTTSKAKYKGSMLYVADLEGKQWKLNLTNKGTLYEVTPIFDAQATVENDRMEFFQITPTIGSDDNLWGYYGTGNQQKVQRISTNINNRIFGLKDNNFPNYKNVNGLNNTAISSLKNTTVPGSVCPVESDLGWYINLEANERITGKLALYNEILYATRYLPNSNKLCAPGGAILTEHDSACGYQTRKIELGEGIATGAVVYKDNIYLGVSGAESADLKDDKGNVVGQKTDNIIVITPKKTGSKSKGSLTEESWREIF
jgi:Mg-chelatase subunit ChlD